MPPARDGAEETKSESHTNPMHAQTPKTTDFIQLLACIRFGDRAVVSSCTFGEAFEDGHALDIVKKARKFVLSICPWLFRDANTLLHEK